jgi:ParB family chromosome partitioning protein
MRRKLEEARHAMRAAIEARDVPEIECVFLRAHQILTDAQVLELRCKREKNVESQRRYWEIALCVERLRAQWLVETEKTELRLIRPKDTRFGAPTDLITLDAPGQPPRIGIDRIKSQQLQAFAKLSEEQFQVVLANSSKMLTVAGILRLYAKPKPNLRKGKKRARIEGLRTDEIKVGQRHRKNMGDIEGLARSIADVGLLHPIVIRPDGTLIAGERRLAAYKLLRRTEIPVTIVDLDDIVRGELAENADRKDFLPSEIEAIRRALEPIEKAAAKERMSQGGKGGKVSQPSDEPARARDKIGALAGVSGRTVEKIAAVVAAAEAEPEKFGHLVEEMDKTGKVDRAHKQLRKKGEGQRRTPRKTKPAAQPAVNDAPDDDALAQELAPASKPDAASTPAGQPAAPDGDVDLPTYFGPSRRQLTLDERLGNLISLTEEAIFAFVPAMRAAGRLPELFRRVRRVADKLEANAAADGDQTEDCAESAAIERGPASGGRAA